METLQNRLICFMDVLGFSNQLQTQDILELHDKYSSFIDIAKDFTFNGTRGDNMERTNFAVAEIFSDSIILVSNDIDDIYNVNNFIGGVLQILELGFEQKFPFRGVITLGDFIVDKERNIFLSKEFPSLINLEKEIELPSCVIMEEAKQTIIESIFGGKSYKEGVIPSGDLPIIKYNIPLKEDKYDDMWCLNFTFFLAPQGIQEGIDYLKGKKKDNFLSYINYISQIPFEVQELDEEFKPAKYIKSMKTRSGVRMGFLNEKQEPCEPPKKPIQFTAIGRWKE